MCGGFWYRVIEAWLPSAGGGWGQEAKSAGLFFGTVCACVCAVCLHMLSKFKIMLLMRRDEIHLLLFEQPWLICDWFDLWLSPLWAENCLVKSILVCEHLNRPDSFNTLCASASPLKRIYLSSGPVWHFYCQHLVQQFIWTRPFIQGSNFTSSWGQW